MTDKIVVTNKQYLVPEPDDMVALTRKEVMLLKIARVRAFRRNGDFTRATTGKVIRVTSEREGDYDGQ